MRVKSHLRVSPWLLLLLCIPVRTAFSAQNQPSNQLPDAAFLEFLGSFDQPESDLLKLTFDAVEDETGSTRAKPVAPAKDKTHDKN